jgi:hypothetical protein
MRVQPDNLTEVWEGAKRDILANHPELPETRAGSLAAARVFNWFHEDWATFSDAVRNEAKNSAGSSEEIDPQRPQLYDELIDWTPLYKLQQMSGSRNLLRDLEHPIVTEQSTPPAEVVRIRNHWRTERMEARLETLSDLKEAWGNIRAEFRPRTKGEGCLYTNSQGIHAIKTAFELIQEQPYSGRVDALTANLSGAAEAIEYFKDMAGVLGGKAGAGVSHLADLFEEAILDAVTNKREGFAAVDTTAPGDKDDPPLTYLKKLARHEATHVWQYTINHKSPGLLSDEVIKADPDYPRLKRAFSAYYENIKPGEIVAEAVAFVVAGDWKRAGFTNEERGLKFINRFFSNVVIHYGEKALDSLRMTHPKIKEVIENVRNIPIREFGSGRETEKDIGGGPESVAEGSGNDSEATRGRETIRSTQSRLAGGWTGEDVGGLRGDGPQSGALKSYGQEIIHIDTGLNTSRERIAAAEAIGADIRIEGLASQRSAANVSQAALDMGERAALPSAGLPQNSATDDDRRDAVNADLIKSLQTIANIESIDPDGMRYTWRSLAIESAMIAREALAYHEIHTENFEVLSGEPPPGTGAFSNSGANHMVEALREIANVEFLDPGQYTWKERMAIAGTIAREALTNISFQYESGQEESLLLQAAGQGKSAPGELSLSNILSNVGSDVGADIGGLDRGYEENDYDQYFSF